HKADPGAKVVLSGLANESWKYLDGIYRASGRRWFDLVAVHPFTTKVTGVVTILKKIRAVMAHHQDATKPLDVTELSWTSARGKTKWTYGIEQDERGQAVKLRMAFELLAKERSRLRIDAVYWYTWMTFDRD